MKLEIRTITVPVALDEANSTAHYFLPSGFEDTHIHVLETPVDLEIEHMSSDALKAWLMVNGLAPEEES